MGNAHHIKNVPGRKTDVRDAEWLADLVRHGLIAKSFVPPPPIRVLRDLLRYRRKLVESRTAERNRLLKLLETANIKLSSVASDVFGVSGSGSSDRGLVRGPNQAGALHHASEVSGKHRQWPHHHPVDEEITVLSGTWYVGQGETMDAAKAVPLRPGTFIFEPAKAWHWTLTKSEPVEVEIHGMGPRANISAR